MPEPQTTGERGATKRSTVRCDPPIIRPVSKGKPYYTQHIYSIFYASCPVLEHARVRAPVSTPVPRVNGRLEG